MTPHYQALRYRGDEVRVAARSERDRVARMWAARGTYFELPLLERVASLGLRGTYVDGGANVGNHSLFFLRHTACESLVAFEPFPETADLLEQNLNTCAPPGKAWAICRVALGDEHVDVEVGGALGENSGSMHVLGDRNPRQSQSSPRFAARARVPMRALDDALPAIGISLVKLDLEGMELAALKGARETVARDRPVIVAELPTQELLAAFQEEVDSHGCYDRDPRPYGPGLPTYLWLPRHLQTSQTTKEA